MKRFFGYSVLLLVVIFSAAACGTGISRMEGMGISADDLAGQNFLVERGNLPSNLQEQAAAGRRVWKNKDGGYGILNDDGSYTTATPGGSTSGSDLANSLPGRYNVPGKGVVLSPEGNRDRFADGAVGPDRGSFGGHLFERASISSNPVATAVGLVPAAIGAAREANEERRIFGSGN